MVPWLFGRVSTIHGSNKGGMPLRTRKATKPIVGYRTWLIADPPALKSIHIDYIWQVENEAECRAGGDHTDPAPSLHCADGLYSQLPSHPLDEWTKITAGRIRASGTVALTGRVIRCEYGYKAQYAELQSPIIIEAECRKTILTNPCFNTVTLVQPAGEDRYPYAYCPAHLPDVKDGLLPVAAWMTEVCRRLEDGYSGIEFLSELAEW